MSLMWSRSTGWQPVSTNGRTQRATLQCEKAASRFLAFVRDSPFLLPKTNISQPAFWAFGFFAVRFAAPRLRERKGGYTF